MDHQRGRAIRRGIIAVAVLLVVYAVGGACLYVGGNPEAKSMVYEVPISIAAVVVLLWAARNVGDA